jgi:hypothetical protein
MYFEKFMNKVGYYLDKELRFITQKGSKGRLNLHLKSIDPF